MGCDVFLLTSIHGMGTFALRSLSEQDCTFLPFSSHCLKLDICWLTPQVKLHSLRKMTILSVSSMFVSMMTSTPLGTFCDARGAGAISDSDSHRAMASCFRRFQNMNWASTLVLQCKTGSRAHTVSGYKMSLEIENRVHIVCFFRVSAREWTIPES